MVGIGLKPKLSRDRRENFPAHLMRTFDLSQISIPARIMYLRMLVPITKPMVAPCRKILEAWGGEATGEDFNEGELEGLTNYLFAVAIKRADGDTGALDRLNSEYRNLIDPTNFLDAQ